MILCSHWRCYYNITKISLSLYNRLLYDLYKVTPTTDFSLACNCTLLRRSGGRVIRWNAYWCLFLWRMGLWITWSWIRTLLRFRYTMSKWGIDRWSTGLPKTIKNSSPLLTITRLTTCLVWALFKIAISNFDQLVIIDKECLWTWGSIGIPGKGPPKGFPNVFAGYKNF